MSRTVLTDREDRRRLASIALIAGALLLVLCVCWLELLIRHWPSADRDFRPVPAALQAAGTLPVATWPKGERR